MELGTKNKEALKDQHAKQTGPEKKDKGYLDDGRDGQLPDVKTYCRGHIDVQIAVVYPVESPQKRDFMVEKVPDAEHKIHEDHCCKELYPGG